MTNVMHLDQFDNAFSTSFDNQKVWKHYLTTDIMSGVCKNLNKISELIKSQKFGRTTFAGTSFKDRGFSPAVVNE